MFELLYDLDVLLFVFINGTLSNPIFDKFFVILTDVKSWYIAYIILWFLCFFKGGRIGKIAAITAIFLIAVSDQISSNLLKNLFERVRPCNALEDVNILVGCNKSFSLPSSHSVNNFAIAVFFSIIFPHYKKILFTVASLVALSRVYVGVHYPSDIIFGAIIGFVIGYLFAKFAYKIDEHFKNKPE